LKVKAHEVLVNGAVLELTRMEHQLLELLLRRRGEVVTHAELGAEIWGPGVHEEHNFVEAHISRIRAKLRALGVEDVLITVRGVGYKMAE
jgi:two-component system OmpR family response regulator